MTALVFLNVKYLSYNYQLELKYCEDSKIGKMKLSSAFFA